jgi:hypothetical protein
MKTRKFADGGETDLDVEMANASDDPIAYMNKAKRWTDTERTPEKPKVVTKEEFAKSFKSAFADARSSGDKTFEWNGKKYSTAVASGAKAAPTAKETSATEKAFADTSRAKDAPAKPKYQSLQDRAEDYAAKRAASGEGMYGGKKAVSEPRKVTQVAKSDLRGPFSGMGADYKPKMRGGESFKAGGSVKGWGQARGSRAAKIV